MKEASEGSKVKYSKKWVWFWGSCGVQLLMVFIQPLIQLVSAEETSQAFPQLSYLCMPWTDEYYKHALLVCPTYATWIWN